MVSTYSSTAETHWWEEHRSEALDIYRSPAFLVSPYGESVLYADFGDNYKLSISFDIRLGDGSSLADPKNASLLSECYDFICISALTKEGRRNPGPETARLHVFKAIYFLDYLLLNHCRKLVKYGFSAISSQDLVRFIRTVASSNRTVDVLYGWQQRLGSFLIQGGDSLLPAEYQALVTKEPRIEPLDYDPEDALLDLTNEQVRRARAFLVSKNFYNYLKRDGKVTVNTGKIVKEIFGNTLINSVASQFKQIIPELSLGEQSESVRELPGVPTRTGLGDLRATVKVVAEYKGVALNWRRLVPFGIGISPGALDSLERYDPSRTIKLKVEGHTNPIPTPHMLYAMKSAMQFYYDHADHLLASYSTALAMSEPSGLRPAPFFSASDITAILEPETLSFGVDRWAIGQRADGFSHPFRPPDFHQTLRRTNCGLYDMVKVLYGAMLVIVGFMTAGRYGEVNDLTNMRVDEVEKWLQYSTRKSGFGDIRKDHWRPIPMLVTEILAKLYDFKLHLRANGVQAPEELFATPSFHGGLLVASNAFNSCLDIFSDYIQMPTASDGKRYYIRQHQLRQFFILAFFYAGGIGGLDTLRWFVRHFDPSQLWAYLRQNVPGSVMMKYKAVALKGMLRSDSEEVADLAVFLRRRLRVKGFDIMTDSELVECLEELQEIGNVVVEPIFYSNSHGKTWRMGVTIFGD